jgi:hypothetical protein
VLNRFLGLLLLYSACLTARTEPPPEKAINDVIADLAATTGFVQKKPVRVEVIGRAGWKAWIDEQITENVKLEEIRAEELTLKRFGLIPQDFDLRAATVDLLGEQAAAVYDHRKKRLLFVDGSQEAMGDIVLVHELAHALADQNFDLTKFLEQAPASDEAQLARMAVVEGQATWLMYDAQMRKMGMSLKTNSAALEMMAAAGTNLAAGMFPVFEKAPLYLRETLLFPYTAGLLFQQAAIERLDKKAFSEVLKRPPATAREILHPEIWLSGWKAEAAPLPAIERKGEYRMLTEGTVGELDWRILFEQYAGAEKARAMAPGWRGGRYDLLEHKEDGHTILRFASVWKDEETSKEFIRLYKRVLDGKWTNHRLEVSGDDELRGTGDDGAYRVWRKGRLVMGLDGMKP